MAPPAAPAGCPVRYAAIWLARQQRRARRRPRRCRRARSPSRQRPGRRRIRLQRPQLRALLCLRRIPSGRRPVPGPAADTATGTGTAGIVTAEPRSTRSPDRAANTCRASCWPGRAVRSAGPMFRRSVAVRLRVGRTGYVRVREAHRPALGRERRAKAKREVAGGRGAERQRGGLVDPPALEKSRHASRPGRASRSPRSGLLVPGRVRVLISQPGLVSNLARCRSASSAERRMGRVAFLTWPIRRSRATARDVVAGLMVMPDDITAVCGSAAGRDRSGPGLCRRARRMR